MHASLCWEKFHRVGQSRSLHSCSVYSLRAVQIRDSGLDFIGNINKLSYFIGTKFKEGQMEGDTATLCVKQQTTNGSSNGKQASNGQLSKQRSIDPKTLIPELCNHFYHLGWASGTGGGLSIRQNGYIYCAPSGVQKERIQAEDMFVLNEQAQILERPQDPALKCSECLSLFMVAFNVRQAGCCIHSHSINANLVTALYSEQSLKSERAAQWQRQRQPGGPSFLGASCKEFRISNQEMIKGIKIGSTDKAHQYNDTLVVPIIDNVLRESDLAGAMEEAVRQYPLSNAVLVRNHGVYVWGKTWQQAKSMTECYDYLFGLKLEAYKFGFDWMLLE